MTLRARLEALVARHPDGLPHPGEGGTAARLRLLFAIAADDLALARMAEAHFDAVSILHEAARPPQPGLYGVWASEQPSLVLRGDRITGSKAFCTGAGIVDRALVTVASDQGPLLVDLDVGCAGRGATEASGSAAAGTITVDRGQWATPAFADTATATVTVHGVTLEPGAVVGPPGWYLQRPGFWAGALSPAACWAGGASPLVDAVAERAAQRPNPHLDAHLGALHAARWRCRQLLDAAGAALDAEPDDAASAQRLALTVRHEIDHGVGEILDRFGRALGPRPYAFDGALQLRIAEVQLYRRQCHAEIDLATLGMLLRGGDHPPPNPR